MDKIAIVLEDGEESLFWEGTFWKKSSKWLQPKDIRILIRAHSLQEAEQIWDELELQAAKVLVARWLGKKRLFIKELQQKMHSFGFCAKAIEIVIITYKNLGALDDEDLLQCKARRELRKGRGVKNAVLQCKRWIKETTTVSSDMRQQEEEAITKLLEKKRIQNVLHLSWKEKQSLYALLLRRGFSYDAIASILQNTEHQV